jgi:hypothetical protein
MSIIETVLATGDLSKLTQDQRVAYYRARCAAAGVNPLFKPFEYLSLNGKLVLYGTKELASQLRQVHQVSVTKTETAFEEGLVLVTVYAKTAAGKEDSDVGVVPIEGLKGEARANAIHKAVTKAKRRVTLSICGLSELDETEVATIPASRAVRALPPHDPETGELTEQLEASTVDAYAKQIAEAKTYDAIGAVVAKSKGTPFEGDVRQLANARLREIK